MLLRVSLATTLITLAFGLYPFNFIPRNDLDYDTEAKSLIFHSSSQRDESDRVAIAFTDDALSLSPAQYIAIEFEIAPFKRPEGLGVILELSDEHEIPLLSISQWYDNLVIRSRRYQAESNYSYVETGLRSAIIGDQFQTIRIVSSRSGIHIYRNGNLERFTPRFPLIDPNEASDCRLSIGNNASGTKRYFGRLRSLSISSSLQTPPIIEYCFDQEVGDRVHNQSDTRFALQMPKRFRAIRKSILQPLNYDRFLKLKNIEDILVNLFGFTPFAYCAFALCMRRSSNRRFAVAIAVGASFILSLGIELGQVYLPSRESSQRDLILNTMSGLLTLPFNMAIRLVWGIKG